MRHFKFAKFEVTALTSRQWQYTAPDTIPAVESLHFPPFLQAPTVAQDLVAEGPTCYLIKEAVYQPQVAVTLFS
jgi:hypothetical protein